MRCTHCHKNQPSRGYCCEKAELETLRAVMDEVSTHLDSEVVSAKSIGALDVVESVQHASGRLRAARTRAA